MAEDAPSDARFDALYRQYGRRLRVVARNRGIPPAECEDLVHEAFTRAIKGIQDGSAPEPASLIAWLYGIFNNLVAEYWRTTSRHERLLPPGDSELLETVVFVPPDRDVAQLVRRALIKLPRRHRLVLILNVHQGLTINQIAPILGRAPGTVGAILADAKKKFRHHYVQAQENDGLKRLQE